MPNLALQHFRRFMFPLFSSALLAVFVGTSSLFSPLVLAGNAEAKNTASGDVASGDSVQVYFLVGQSNMEGKGNPVHLDTYRNDPLIAPTYASLKDGDGWAVRDDVWITYPTKSKGAKHGPLTVDYGTKGENSIGPEFGFGHAIGNASDEKVLLIKIAWGGKSLAVDFRPPSEPPTDEEVQALLERIQRKKPKTTEGEVREQFGHYYREVVRHAKAEMDSFEGKFPELKGSQLEIAGFVWHQGFNDKIRKELKEQSFAPYTKWLGAFIRDIRKDLDAPDMPFVIGELSTGGIPSRGDFQKAQAATAELEGFKGNVVFVPTAEYYDTEAQKLFEQQLWKGTDEEKARWNSVGNDRPYHYLGSGKTYYLKGVAFADAMIALQKK